MRRSEVEARIKAVEANLRQTVQQARAIVDGAKSENRGITAAEEKQVKDLLTKSDTLREELTSLREGAASADDIRGKVANPSMGDRPGFKALAKSIATGELKWKGRLEDFLSKAVTATDMTDASGGTTTNRVPGIQSLTEDLRSLSASLGSQPAGNQLHVQEFRITNRTASGSSRRDPLSTANKETLDVTVEEVVADLEQFALIADGLPVALLDAEPALQAALQSSLGLALRADLDAYLLEEFATFASVVSSGTSIEEKTRQAMVDIAGNGGNADVAVLNDSDLASMDLDTIDEAINKWPFGLRVIGTAQIPAGDGLVMDSSGLALYLGNMDVAVDPYAGTSGANFKRNQMDIRAEFLALAFIREPAKFVKFDLNFVT
jgi:hypothetical protein